MKRFRTIYNARSLTTQSFTSVQHQIQRTGITRLLVLPKKRPVQCTPGVWRLITRLRITVHGRPSVVDPSTSSEMPKAGYYAVASGRVPGIYTTWTECEAQVKGYNGAKYKKFSSQTEAQAFISSASTTPYPKSSTETPNFAETSNSRSSSPPRYAAVPSLPPNLAVLAERGWRFTPDHRLVVYTDGSGLGNGQRGARAGMGVWWGSEGDALRMNLAERVPGVLQTNNRGELLSVIRALETCPFPDLPIEIRTDSQYTIMCMTTYLPTWLKKGFQTNPSTNQYKTSRTPSYAAPSQAKTIKNADMVKHLLVLLRRRRAGAGVRFRHVYGHSGFEGNEGADRLAKMGASMSAVEDRLDWLDPDDEDVRATELTPTTDVELEVDENWLMSADELAQFEREFQEV